jgi:hypothetical protein
VRCGEEGRGDGVRGSRRRRRAGVVDGGVPPGARAALDGARRAGPARHAAHRRDLSLRLRPPGPGARRRRVSRDVKHALQCRSSSLGVYVAQYMFCFFQFWAVPCFPCGHLRWECNRKNRYLALGFSDINFSCLFLRHGGAATIDDARYSSDRRYW